MPSRDDRTLRDLHRGASLAGRPGIGIPAKDLELNALDRREADRLRKSVRRLVRSGRITPVRRDLVVLPDATGLSNVGIADLVDVVAARPYVITGGRALEHHRLTDQHFFHLVALVPTRVSELTYRRERAIFIVTDRRRIWGWTRQAGPRYATAERAIIDSIASSRYGVSLSQAIIALASAGERDPKLPDKLLAVVRRYDVAATARRVGLLVDRILGPDAAEPFHELIGPMRSPVPLRRGGPDTGPVDGRWRVIVNANIEAEQALR